MYRAASYLTRVFVLRRSAVAARATPGKVALAMDAFATALRRIPAILSDNAGYDTAALVAQLRAAHAQSAACTMGLDMEKGASVVLFCFGLFTCVRC